MFLLETNPSGFSWIVVCSVTETVSCRLIILPSISWIVASSWITAGNDWFLRVAVNCSLHGILIVISNVIFVYHLHKKTENAYLIVVYWNFAYESFDVYSGHVLAVLYYIRGYCGCIPVVVCYRLATSLCFSLDISGISEVEIISKYGLDWFYMYKYFHLKKKPMCNIDWSRKHNLI